MATLLDTGLLSFLTPIFIFLFIFVVIYALLAKTKLLGDKDVSALNFLAAVCVAAIAVFAGTITNVVAVVTPWIVFIIIILTLLFGMFIFFGVKNEDIWETIGGKTVVYVLILLIIVIGLSQVFESQISPYDSASSDQVSPTTSGTGAVQSSTVKGEIIKTLIHPRLLAAIFMLVVAAFTIKLIADKF